VKCIVKGCPNEADQNFAINGAIVGTLCSPCFRFVNHGIGGESQLYKNALEYAKFLADSESLVRQHLEAYQQK